jgi:N-acetylglucosaminyl-diphospho-decaprenol L-rhamnosyltransferase
MTPSRPAHPSPRPGASPTETAEPTESAESADGSSAVAAVVVTFNAADHITDMLASLRTAMGDRPGPIVVVDNGSRDATISLVEREPGVELITQSNVGFAAGVNRGVRAVPAGHDILILNPDVRLRPDALDLLRQVVADDDRVVLAVPRLVDGDGHTHRSLRRAPSITRNLAQAVLGGTRAGRFGESYAIEASAGRTEVDWATGAVMLVRRGAFEAVDGLDESFFLYSEETDLCLRLRERGDRIVAEPRAVVEHVGGDMGSHPDLWALRAVNRVRRYQRRSGPLAGFGFRCSQLAFEARRAAFGDRVSRAALRALLVRDLDAAALRLTRGLGGDTSRLDASADLG